MTRQNLEISLDDVRVRLWQELTRALYDRHHDWRSPILATQGINGSGPQARTVVLRHADANEWTLRVYTDARSAKCSELLAQPLAQLTFWSKRLHWQLRVSALTTVDVESAQVDATWDRVKQSRAAADYLSVSPPGTPQSSSYFISQNPDDSPQGHHLAILDFRVLAVDWLALSKNGHRRARFTPAGLMEWLSP